MPRGGDPLVEDGALQGVGLLQVVPVQIGPAVRLHELGALGNGLGPELADEAGEHRKPGQRGREVPVVAVVPAEVEVGVGPPGRVGQDTGMGDDGTGAVGPLQRAADRAVEPGLVPGREELRGGEAGRRRGAVPSLSVDGQRLVVAAPDGDRRVVAEEVTAWRAWRTAWRRTSLYPHCRGRSCQISSPARSAAS